MTEQLTHGFWGAWVQGLRCMGLVALWHVESSLTRDQTRLPYIGRWILNH